MSDNLFTTSTAESASDWLIAHCDGGSRGNPGPAGYGAVIEDAHGKVLVELSEFLGNQTNNFAEYGGLLGVLRWAVEHKVSRLRVISDSELMVKQMQGKYAVKSPILKPLFDEAKILARRIPTFEMRHTLRGGNKTADRLANEAMDRGMGRSPLPTVGKPDDAGAPRQTSHYSSAASGSSVSRPTAPRPAAPNPAKPAQQILEGYVKDGVVHLLGGQLPDGVFVKIVRD
jgi:probable phosphoglycerate mutase